MSCIVVTFKIDPEPHEADDGDPTGLTEKAYDTLNDGLGHLGGYDIEIRRDEA